MPKPVSRKISTATWPLTLRLWREWISPHTPVLVLVLICIVGVAGASGLYPVLIQKSFEAFTAKDQSLIGVISLAVIGVTTLRGFSLYAQTVLTNRVVTRIEADMQVALYRHLLNADIEQLAKASPAELTQRFTTDFAFIKEALTRLSTVLLRDVATVIALVAAMIWIDPVLTVSALCIAPLVAIPIGRLGQKLRRVSTTTQESIGQMATLVSESLSGIRVAKTFQMEGYLGERARLAFENVRKLKMKAANARARLDPLLEIAGGVAVAGVLMLIGQRIARDETSIGDFTGFVTALLMAAQPIRSLGNLNAIVQEAAAALARYYAIQDRTPLIRDQTGARSLSLEGAGEIKFENVGFSYHEGVPTIKDINLTAQAGRLTALVGRSGSGKSTLLSLLPRLYDADSGKVLIDGQDIRTLTLKSLRGTMAIVSQDVVLFDDTIAANIAAGRQNISFEAIESAAKAAAAHEFILSLPHGYDTRIGPSGMRLSGGERQRLSLARAILKNAPILLLDEATSALDAQSEHLIQTALTKLRQGRTTLAIAHRLSTLREADQILVMDEGKIVERGTHTELMAMQGIYAHLSLLQSAGKNTEAVEKQSDTHIEA